MMMSFTIGQMLAALGVGGNDTPNTLSGLQMAGVSTDSRSINEGEVFFAIKGDTFDGAQFIDTAFSRGAVLSVVNRGSVRRFPASKPVIEVEDTVAALGKAAGAYRKLFQGPVIGITGTSGKTTVKEMAVAVLGTKFSVLGTKGNFNNQIGLPLSIFGLETSHKCAVFEMGMSASGEIAYLADIAKPTIGTVINAGPAHMEFFPSLDAIADAKAEMLDAITPDGTGIINKDDPLIAPRGGRCKGRLVTFGITSEADYRAKNIAICQDGTPRFEIEGNSIHLKIPGVHNVYNALAAYTIGAVAGVSGNNAAEVLSEITAPGMRMETVTKNGVRYINDSYNANPMSMKSAADVLRWTVPEKDGRKIAVLGDMLELGKISREAHIAIGAEFGSLEPAWLCFVGDNTELYRRGAVSTGMDNDAIRSFKTAEEAAQFVQTIKKTGDVILVKGSRRLKMEKILAD